MKTILILVLCLGVVLPQSFAQQTQTQTQPTQTQQAPEIELSLSTNPPPKVPKDFDNGLKVAMEAIQELGQVEDSDKVRRVNDIAYKLAERAAPNMPYFSFHIVKMEEPNAFALPGGFIFVTTGMLDLDLNDDELAALLGHEITHVTKDHIHRMGKRQTLMNLLYQALIFGVAFGIKDSGSSINPTTGMPRTSAKTEILQGSAAFGALFQELLIRGFSRDLELEADQGGMTAAAGAGFSPQGTTHLFDKMRKRVYEAPGYGYWRTHPYLDDRAAIARSQASLLETSKAPPDDKAYRIRTQEVLMNQISKEKDEKAKREMRKMALNAWPVGKIAQELRAWFIKEAEDQEMKKEPFFRDYGKLIKLYQENLDDIQKEDPTASMAVTLKKGREKLEKERDSVLPLYEEVLVKQAFDTEMLKRFISNYPKSPRLPEVQFRLAENYRILHKHRDAVDLYLSVLKSETDSPWKGQSRQSVLLLLPQLDDLSSCYKIASQAKDSELERGAKTRMQALSGSFSSLKNGYEFRRSYPDSNFEEPVLTRMTKLASDTLRQGRLYQSIGEYQKALDQYNEILRYCSDLPVADEVKDTIVDFQELHPSTS